MVDADKAFKPLDGTSNTTPVQDDEDDDDDLEHIDEDKEDDCHEDDVDDDADDDVEISSEESDHESDHESDEDFDDFSVESYSLSSIDTGASAESSSVVTGVTTEEPESTDFLNKKGVRWGRYIVLGTLAVSLGILQPFTLYRVAENFEESWSENVGDDWQTNTRQAFMALDAIGVDSWLAADNTWPDVVFPDFSTWSMQSQLLAPAIQSIVLVPSVSDDERSDYEKYVSNSSVILGLQGTEVKTSIYEMVQGTTVVAPGPGPYDPIRQLYPLVEGSINYNLLSDMYTAEELKESRKSASAIVGQMIDDGEASSTFIQMLLPTMDESSSPYGILVYPIRQTLGKDGASGKAVGSLVALISWASLFPLSKEPLTAVLRNSCDQVASWKINESKIVFLGYQDAHDSKYSSYRHSYDLETLELDRYTISKIPLSDSGESICQYQLDVYPSSGGGSDPMNAMLFVGIALGFCAWTVVVFLVYDYVLERRNKETLTSALEARAIISSLFPATVRDRLFETKRVQRKQKKKKLKKLKKKMKQLRRHRKKKDQEDSKEQSPPTPEPPPPTPLSPRAVQSLLESVPSLGTSMRNLDVGNKSKSQNLVMHPKHQLKNFLATTSSAFEISEEFSLNKPIADLFPHTTVLFADIVGFTAWSSERAPEDVFVLLQTIYHSFDKIARRRGVFKVETIGDCYVAVTGLPDPQPDHAVRMTKFARECMTKMTEVTKKLEVSLGPDTGDLCLRLGLNSGPVTAGVLQGEKSRFQLFGDTVNTASRMESTGEMNRVHVSKSTADLLIEAGKSYWVKPRTDLVHAKGKGNVQTFWLVTRENFTPASTRSSDELDAELKRMAPSRSRSTFAKGEPIRGVKRTTSDSVTKVDKLSDMVTQGRESNDMREERLVQWQLELFTRLLKKIVASRDESPEKQKNARNSGWEGISRGSHTLTRSNSFEMSLNGFSEHTTASQAPPVMDRFGNQEMNGAPIVRMPTRESSFRIPQRRQSVRTAASFDVSVSTFHSSAADFSSHDNDDELDKIVVDEVAEIITLPKFTAKSIKALDKANSVVLDEEVVSQMKDYINTIASMYRKNPFHNFEHASHVTMSANKLLNRIVIPEHVDYERESNDIASDLHDYTYGITSDPLTQFAIVFSALVHDVDHTGVPNGQLAKENPDMAALYRNQSLAEQNSVDLAWDLFMDPRYKKLQDCIAAHDEERKRFRQLVVNSVMATDIFDPTMKALRNKRWEKAFHTADSNGVITEITEATIEEDRNMKATIVIEHIIQASDVAHTMQHWHIYQKWNERLFDEMFSAFECGRSATNPADGWYRGELWFFDNYVIPLAKKLEECHVFGVASDECLNYAQANRNEWSIKGEELVAEMVQRYHQRKFFVAGMAKKRHPRKRSPRRPTRTNSIK